MMLPAYTQEGKIYLKLENMWRLYAQQSTGFQEQSKSQEQLNAQRLGTGNSTQSVRVKIQRN